MLPDEVCICGDEHARFQLVIVEQLIPHGGIQNIIQQNTDSGYSISHNTHDNKGSLRHQASVMISKTPHVQKPRTPI